MNPFYHQFLCESSFIFYFKVTFTAPVSRDTSPPHKVENTIKGFNVRPAGSTQEK